MREGGDLEKGSEPEEHQTLDLGRAVTIAPNGEMASRTQTGFIPGRIRFCLRYADTHSASSRDRMRLDGLSAEGCSPATTVRASRALRWMPGKNSGLPSHTGELLGFTEAHRAS